MNGQNLVLIPGNYLFIPPIKTRLSLSNRVMYPGISSSDHRNVIHLIKVKRALSYL